jgi:hypothetical protein
MRLLIIPSHLIFLNIDKELIGGLKADPTRAGILDF